MTDKNEMGLNKIPDIREIEEQGRILGESEEAVLEKISGSGWTHYARVGMAALSGIDWIGGIASAISLMSSEADEKNKDHLVYYWIREHELKLMALSQTIEDIFTRFDSLGDRITERINSDEYLILVRKSFKIWNEVESEEKRSMLKSLIINAADLEVNQDDWIKMYIEWIQKYNEFHFHVIREIYDKPGITRYQIWMNLRGELPSDTSSEADLFKLLIRDLSTGSVIRQRSTAKGKKTPFDRQDPYDLTELGKQFVIYVMTDTANKIGDAT